MLILMLALGSQHAVPEERIRPDDPDANEPPEAVETVEDITSVEGAPWECEDMARISRDGLALTKNFEGCSLVAYDDDPTARVGVWTIGYGHTGPDVCKGLRITQEQAEELLAQDLREFEQCVENAISRPATQDQFDAMVAFAFNVGCGRAPTSERRGRGFRGSVLLRKFNAGDLKGAEREFRRWVNDGAKRLDGLRRRRAAEVRLFRDEDWRVMLKRNWKDYLEEGE